MTASHCGFLFSSPSFRAVCSRGVATFESCVCDYWVVDCDFFDFNRTYFSFVTILEELSGRRGAFSSLRSAQPARRYRLVPNRILNRLAYITKIQYKTKYCIPLVRLYWYNNIYSPTVPVLEVPVFTAIPSSLSCSRQPGQMPTG